MNLYLNKGNCLINLQGFNCYFVIMNVFDAFNLIKIRVNNESACKQ